MDYLPPWVVTIAAVTVGLGPGLAILSARPLARLLHCALGPSPKAAPKHSREAERRGSAGVAASQSVTG
jgi:hypothetical protein